MRLGTYDTSIYMRSSDTTALEYVSLILNNTAVHNLDKHACH